MKNYEYIYTIQGQEQEKAIESYFLDDISREFRSLSEDGWLMSHPMDYMGVRFEIIEKKTNKVIFSYYACLGEVTGIYYIEKKLKRTIVLLKEAMGNTIFESSKKEYKKELKEEEERLRIFQKHYYNPNSWEEDFDSLFYSWE